MTTRSLAYFSSIVDGAPCFVIPVFSVPGVNYSCVQDLDPSGKIVRFAPFDPSGFFSVPVLPPSIQRSLGDGGLLAFWADDATVIVGSREELRGELSQIDEAALPAFVAVEAMTLVGDQARLTNAANRASTDLRSGAARQSYTNRMLRRAVLLASLEADLNESEPRTGELDQILLDLERPLKEQEWYEKWKSAWQRYRGNSRLFAIARWRLDNFECSRIDEKVVKDLCYPRPDPERADFIFSRLKTQVGNWRSWHAIWMTLHSSDVDHDVLADIGYRYLSEDAIRRRQISYQWMTVWRRLWNDRRLNEDTLVQLAEHGKEASPYRDHFVEVVIMPLARDTNLRWAMEYLLSWLKRPRGLVLWVDNFILHRDEFERSEYLMTGVAWLKRYGRGMNVWLRLWSHLKPLMRPDLASELAEEWLVTARKDLSSWPTVFAQAMDESSFPSARLVHAARLWVDAARGAKRNAQIERVAEGTS